MSNAPKFEFEDGSPATPATPAKSDPGAAPAPAFNPFADQKVDLSPQAMVAAAAAAAPAPTAAPEPAVPIGSPGSVADDAAAGRDLWNCPHCGSGNQKKRTTCRACGKDPLEPVKLPWFRTVPGMAGIAGGVLLLIIIAVFAGRTDKSLHPAGPAKVDTAVRTWGTMDDTEDRGEKRAFNKRGWLSVSGRIAGAKALPGQPWITTVVLVLGAEAKDDAKVKSWEVSISDRNVSCSAANHVVLHCLFDDKQDLQRGGWLSLKGYHGHALVEASFVKATQGQGHRSVLVTESDSAAP